MTKNNFIKIEIVEISIGSFEIIYDIQFLVIVFRCIKSKLHKIIISKSDFSYVFAVSVVSTHTVRFLKGLS